MHYVIGDVHGCYDELMVLINKIEATDSEARFILVGDLIDRGPKVWEVLQWALKNITPEGKYQCVRGNHEQLALEWWEYYKKWYTYDKDVRWKPFSDYDIAGKLYQYIQPTGEEGQHAPEDFQELVDFWNSLPYSKQLTVRAESGREVVYRIVHAWYDYDIGEDTEEQHEINLFERECAGNRSNKDEIIVFGHTPTCSERFGNGRGADRPGMICYRENAINVDCGCVFGKHRSEYPCMLGAICLENLEEIYPFDWKERMLELNRSKNELLPTVEAREKAEKLIGYYYAEYLKEGQWRSTARWNMLRKLGVLPQNRR